MLYWWISHFEVLIFIFWASLSKNPEITKFRWVHINGVGSSTERIIPSRAFLLFSYIIVKYIGRTTCQFESFPDLVWPMSIDVHAYTSSKRVVVPIYRAIFLASELMANVRIFSSLFSQSPSRSAENAAQRFVWFDLMGKNVQCIIPDLKILKLMRRRIMERAFAAIITIEMKMRMQHDPCSEFWDFFWAFWAWTLVKLRVPHFCTHFEKISIFVVFQRCWKLRGHESQKFVIMERKYWLYETIDLYTRICCSLFQQLVNKRSRLNNDHREKRLDGINDLLAPQVHFGSNYWLVYLCLHMIE